MTFFFFLGGGAVGGWCLEVKCGRTKTEGILISQESRVEISFPKTNSSPVKMMVSNRNLFFQGGYKIEDVLTRLNPSLGLCELPKG